MEVISADRNGRWREINTWPYGQYQLTVLADARGTLPLEQCAITIWPMVTMHVTITIADGGGPEPLSQLPLGCVTSLRPLRP